MLQPDSTSTATIVVIPADDLIPMPIKRLLLCFGSAPKLLQLHAEGL